MISIHESYVWKGHHKCREDWPNNSRNYERAYNLFLDGILLVLPLIVLGATYSLITQTLWQGMRTEKALKNHLAFDSTHSCTYFLFDFSFPSRFVFTWFPQNKSAGFLLNWNKCNFLEFFMFRCCRVISFHTWRTILRLRTTFFHIAHGNTKNNKIISKEQQWDSQFEIISAKHVSTWKFMNNRAFNWNACQTYFWSIWILIETPSFPLNVFAMSNFALAHCAFSNGQVLSGSGYSCY